MRLASDVTVVTSSTKQTSLRGVPNLYIYLYD